MNVQGVLGWTDSCRKLHAILDFLLVCAHGTNSLDTNCSDKHDCKSMNIHMKKKKKSILESLYCKLQQTKKCLADSCLRLQRMRGKTEQSVRGKEDRARRSTAGLLFASNPHKRVAPVPAVSPPSLIEPPPLSSIPRLHLTVECHLPSHAPIYVCHFLVLGLVTPLAGGSAIFFNGHF